MLLGSYQQNTLSSQLSLWGNFMKISTKKDHNDQMCLLQDWLIDYLRSYVPLKNISLIWRRHNCWWWAAKFRPMLGAQGLWAGRDLYRATPAVTQRLGFSGLIWRNAQFSRLLRHTRGCWGSILAQILTGPCYKRNIGRLYEPCFLLLLRKIPRLFNSTWTLWEICMNLGILKNHTV
jgi:hypothetical protein